MRWGLVAVAVMWAGIPSGCSSPAPKEKPAAAKKSDEEIKQAFTSLQTAIKEKDVEKIWNLLSQDSQADAEREGKAVKEAYSKLSEKEKADYEKNVGLAAKELTAMTGKLYVKSNTFFTGETGEMPESNLDKVVVTDDNTAKVHYIEEEGKGQRETRAAVREDGQWKFVLPVPKAVLK